MSAIPGFGVERRQVNRPNASAFRIHSEELRYVPIFMG
jgi:hypothetical protein